MESKHRAALLEVELQEAEKALETMRERFYRSGKELKDKHIHKLFFYAGRQSTTIVPVGDGD